ncbi:hypothetical protein EVJ58_g104 [Rhodofomes roseus]|uniref:Mating-type protein A-alpha/beta 1 N-terminal domain-containing protein n=1 Tax=Rhodofomes roseus TaxID=34475 RepID=A0A4Y9Z844_9APHY|nr:hypothetical protein EVJ58_g104 [Rhodofomes roseus]
MPSLRDRLLTLQDEFLLAVTDGEAAMQAFDERWHALSEDILASINSSVLDEETISLAQSVSSLIEVYASSFEDLFSVTDTMHADMKTEIEDVFARLTLDSVEDDADVLSPTFMPKIEESLQIIPLESSLHLHHLSFEASPWGSRPPSLVSDSEEESDDDEDELPSPIVIGKRVYEEEWDVFDTMHRREKRPRFDSHASLDCSRVRHLQDKPHASAVAVDCVSEGIVSNPLRPSVDILDFSPRRKRRLSDADIPPLSKRLRGVDSAPRKQIVSNPLPSVRNDLEKDTHILEEWATDFDVVEPATFAPPSLPGPLVFSAFKEWGTCRSERRSNLGAVDLAVTPTDPYIDDTQEADRTPRDVSLVASPLDDDPEPNEIPATAVASVRSPEDPWPEDTADVPRCSSRQSRIATIDGILVKEDEPSSQLLPKTDPYVTMCRTYGMTLDGQRSRSPSPWRTPPPSFETPIFDSWYPPDYTPLDQSLQTGSITPPPSYIQSLDRMTDSIRLFIEKTLGTNALAADGCFAFHQEKRGFAEECVQGMQGGLAIAV